MTTTLITGANRGLGFETARQLAAAGHQVWIGARDDSRGQQAADAVGGRFVHLDVTEYASVAAAVETVGELDVLVNNAGISGGRIGPSEATIDDMRDADQLCRSGLHRDRLQPESRHADRRAGAEAIVRYALIASDGPTGGFFDSNGAERW